jgi:hypothetical protein
MGRDLTWVQKGVPDELSVPGIEWFRAHNLTAMPEVLINPLALYGYGDINVVPAVRVELAYGVHAYTDT